MRRPHLESMTAAARLVLCVFIAVGEAGAAARRRPHQADAGQRTRGGSSTPLLHRTALGGSAGATTSRGSSTAVRGAARAGEDAESGHDDDDGVPLRFLLLEVHGTHGVSVVHERDVPHRGYPSVDAFPQHVHSAHAYARGGVAGDETEAPEPPHPDPQAMVTVSWRPNATHRECFHFRDPRRMIHEHFDGAAGDMNGTHVDHDVGYVGIRIPRPRGLHWAAPAPPTTAAGATGDGGSHIDATAASSPPFLEGVPHLLITEHAHEGWAAAGPRPHRAHVLDVDVGADGDDSGADADAEAESAEPRRRPSTPLASRRRRSVVSDEFPFEPELEVLQKVGATSATYNIVLVAGGYSAASRAKWNSDIAKALKFWKGYTTSERSLMVQGSPLSSQPTNRYFSNFNLFAVWDASPQDGANHPDPDGYVADPRPNRLECSYGTTIKRMLACDRRMTRAVASYAPAADLIMVLVNDPEYGGAAGGGVAYVYAGDTFEKVLHHESAHAAADVADEYDYGFTEEKKIDLVNCAYDKDATPWAKWRERWREGGRDVVPQPVCSYTNYYRPRRGRPGDGSCLMRSTKTASMCEVCREALIDGGFFKRKKIDFTLPRCPVAWETMIIKHDAIGQLHVNPTLQDPYQYVLNTPLWGPPFEIEWRCRRAPAGVPCDGVVIRSGRKGMTSLTVGACTASGADAAERGTGSCGWPGGEAPRTGAYILEVAVKDTVNEVNWVDTARVSRASFRIEIVDDAGFRNARCDDATTHWDCNLRYGRGTDAVCETRTDEEACNAVNCHWNKIDGVCERFYGRQPLPGYDASVGYKICTRCDGDATRCNVSYVVKPQPVEVDVSEDAQFSLGRKIARKISDHFWLPLVGVVAALCMVCGLYTTVRDLVREDNTGFTKCNKWMRWFGMAHFAFLVWGCVVAVAYGIYLWTQTEADLMDSYHLILFLVGGFVGFIGAMFQFNAISSRRKWQLGASILMLAALTVFLVVVAVILRGLAAAAQGTVDRDALDPDEESIRLDELGADVPFLDTLRTSWREATSALPNALCNLQKELKCSGFQKSCFNVVANSYCPDNCPMGNAYTNPCVQVLQKRLQEDYSMLAGLAACAGVLLLVGMLVMIYLFGSYTVSWYEGRDDEGRYPKAIREQRKAAAVMIQCARRAQLARRRVAERRAERGLPPKAAPQLSVLKPPHRDPTTTAMRPPSVKVPRADASPPADARLAAVIADGAKNSPGPADRDTLAIEIAEPREDPAEAEPCVLSDRDGREGVGESPSSIEIALDDVDVQDGMVGGMGARVASPRSPVKVTSVRARANVSPTYYKPGSPPTADAARAAHGARAHIVATPSEDGIDMEAVAVPVGERVEL